MMSQGSPMQRATYLAMTLMLTLVVGSTSADEVFRRGSGKGIKGTISKDSRMGLEFKPRAGAAINIPADEIARVRFTAENLKLNVARNSERNGALTRALEGYQAVVGSLKPAAKKDAEFLIARTRAKIAMADPTKVDEALQAMTAQATAKANSFRHYECVEWLGRLKHAKGDYGGASSEFAKLAGSPMKSHQMVARNLTGDTLLAQNKAAEAEKSYDQVVSMAPNGAAQTAARYEAVLGKAMCQQIQGKFTEAIKSLEGIVANTSPDDDASLHARTFLQKGNCYKAENKSKLAILEYLKVDLLYHRSKAEHAASLYQLAQLWPAAGKPERANEAASKLRKLYPNNEWTQKLAGQ